MIDGTLLHSKYIVKLCINGLSVSKRELTKLNDFEYQQNRNDIIFTRKVVLQLLSLPVPPFSSIKTNLFSSATSGRVSPMDVDSVFEIKAKL